MACLLWMSGRSRQDIEMTLTQHMCETVAAGAVNQVRSRTIDLLPVVISVAESSATSTWPSARTI